MLAPVLTSIRQGIHPVAIHNWVLCIMARSGRTHLVIVYLAGINNLFLPFASHEADTRNVQPPTQMQSSLT